MELALFEHQNLVLKQMPPWSQSLNSGLKEFLFPSTRTWIGNEVYWVQPLCFPCHLSLRHLSF